LGSQALSINAGQANDEPLMKTQSRNHQYLPQIVVGIAVVLFSTAGIAAIMGWRSASAGSPDNTAALNDPAGSSAKAVALSPQSAQTRTNAKGRANSKCVECGLIVSVDEINGYDDDFSIGTADGATHGDWDEKPLKMTTRYEIIVRMADGSNRVINPASLANWRLGGRVIVIAGTIRPQR
jgi:hypothetical protein